MRRQKHQHLFCPKGFTIIELIVVISIIAILMSFAIPMAGKAKQKARVARAKTEIAALETALSAYYADMGQYPPDDPGDADNATTIEHLSGLSGGVPGSGLAAIASDSNWNGPYMEFDADTIVGGQFVDPWNHAYVIQINTDGDPTTTPPDNNVFSFDIKSTGPSGGDEITNY